MYTVASYMDNVSYSWQTLNYKVSSYLIECQHQLLQSSENNKYYFCSAYIEYKTIMHVKLPKIINL